MTGRTDEYRYIIAYKPCGILSSPRDRLGRPTLSSLGIPPTLNPAGRLDLDSEGLVLVTDDGWLIHRLTHPRYHHPKVYLVMVAGKPSREALERLRRGVKIKTGWTRRADVELLQSDPPLPPFHRPLPAPEKRAWLRIVLYEGKKRQIRRMTAAVGHPTLRLVRVGIGPLHLPPDLKPGQWRDLTPAERRMLFDWVRRHGSGRSRNPTRRRRR